MYFSAKISSLHAAQWQDYRVLVTQICGLLACQNRSRSFSLSVVCCVFVFHLFAAIGYIVESDQKNPWQTFQAEKTAQYYKSFLFFAGTKYYKQKAAVVQLTLIRCFNVQGNVVNLCEETIIHSSISKISQKNIQYELILRC